MKTIRIKVKEGMLAGEEKTSCMIFRGVPYAKPPVGELRFQEPKPVEPWPGTRHALAFAAQCPQADPTSGFYGKEFYTDPAYPLPPVSEDCLYLNIWAPVMKRPGGYPVAFWIHGGAFDHGFGSEMEFDGEAFARNDVILVTVNYRVGVFGFFAHPDLKKEDPVGSSGNMGILDQICALKWVHENIAAFGGDPDNITVFGQSAGAMSTQTLISSPLTRGLIAKAVMQSGGGVHNGLGRKIYPENAFRTGEKIMKLCGVSTLAEMRKLPAEMLVSILPDLYKETGVLAFSPVEDGVVLTGDVSSLAEKGRVHNIPYMLGMTSEDITVEKGTDARTSQFYQGMIRFAEARPEGSEPVYLYYFRRQLPGDDAGAFHSSELWYMFGTLGRCWRPMTVHDYKLSDEMVSCWTSFMKNGDPGRGWKPFDEKNRFVRTFM